MKTFKKTSLFYALLLLSTAFNTHKTHTMEPEDVKKVGWVALAGGVIIGGYAAYQQFLSYVDAMQEQSIATILAKQKQPIEPFPFTELPKDVQNTITALLFAGATATSLQEAAQTINALAQVNKELNALINDPQFCLKIIKHLAQHFHCSDQEAAEKLQNKEAKRRLDIQTKLEELCLESTNNQLEELDQQGADLEFTYPNPFKKTYQPAHYIVLTPLMIASQKNNVAMIDYLLSHGANINFAKNDGFTALMYAASKSTIRAENYLAGITKLLTYSHIGINRQNTLGNSALYYAIGNGDANIIALLLDAGADPELANFVDITPLQLAQKKNHQVAIDLIQEAIDKKHEKQGK